MVLRILTVAVLVCVALSQNPSWTVNFNNFVNQPNGGDDEAPAGEVAAANQPDRTDGANNNFCYIENYKFTGEHIVDDEATVTLPGGSSVASSSSAVACGYRCLALRGGTPTAPATPDACVAWTWQKGDDTTGQHCYIWAGPLTGSPAVENGIAGHYVGGVVAPGGVRTNKKKDVLFVSGVPPNTACNLDVNVCTHELCQATTDGPDVDALPNDSGWECSTNAGNPTADGTYLCNDGDACTTGDTCGTGAFEGLCGGDADPTPGADFTVTVCPVCKTCDSEVGCKPVTDLTGNGGTCTGASGIPKCCGGVCVDTTSTGGLSCPVAGP